MHYKNGRIAKNGDKVVVVPSYGPPYAGILYDATPGNDTCNGRVAITSQGDPCPNLKECLHADDVRAAEVPDSTQKTEPVDPAATKPTRIGAVLIALCLFAGTASAAEPISLPSDAVPYTPTRVTQSISVLNDRDHIEAVPVAALDDRRWHQPGGLEGIDRSLYRSQTYRTLPETGRVRTWIGNIGVKNSFGFVQQNRGILREYPVGTRFDEVLTNSKTDQVFEQRTREKTSDGWLSHVTYKDEEQRPTGYTGLKATCSSCHAEAGTGKYAVGLVPGGDTVLSDPLDWSVWTSAPAAGGWQQAAPVPQSMAAPKGVQAPAPTVTQYVLVRDGPRRSHWVAVTGKPTATVTVTPAAPVQQQATTPCASVSGCAPSARRGLFFRR